MAHERKTTVGVTFGALTDPLHQQLKVAPAIVEKHEADAKAITRLMVRGLLSDAEGHRARLRLLKQLTFTLHRRGQ